AKCRLSGLEHFRKHNECSVDTLFSSVFACSPIKNFSKLITLLVSKLMRWVTMKRS
ncbi:unnamed protein product, partial [Brassica rapa subsp. trilocularis]